MSGLLTSANHLLKDLSPVWFGCSVYTAQATIQGCKEKK